MLKSYLWKCTMPSLIWCLKSEALYCSFSCFLICISKVNTVKSLSEALLFAHRDNMLSSKIVLNVRKNFCAQHVLPRFELGIFMYWTCNSMNNLSSYCGLVDAKIRASDKDLLVHTTFNWSLTTKIYCLRLIDLSSTSRNYHGTCYYCCQCYWKVSKV